MIHTPIDQNLHTLQTQTRAERKRQAREQEKNKATYVMTREQLENYKRAALEVVKKELMAELDKLNRVNDSTIAVKEIERVLNTIRCY